MQAPEEAELLMYRKGYKAPYWRAPELLRGGVPTKASDVYAYGMLLYEILYRRQPFEKENKEVRLHPLLFIRHAGACRHGLHTTASKMHAFCMVLYEVLYRQEL